MKKIESFDIDYATGAAHVVKYANEGLRECYAVYNTEAINKVNAIDDLLKELEEYLQEYI